MFGGWLVVVEEGGFSGVGLRGPPPLADPNSGTGSGEPGSVVGQQR